VTGVQPVPPTRRGRPRPVELRATPALLRDVEELYGVEQRLAHRRGVVDELEELRLKLRSRLSRRIPFGLFRVGEFLVGRTEVEPEPSIDVKAAIEGGAVDASVFEPFKRDREPYERWTIRRRRTARVRGAKGA
jgi:hypothetical protein